MFGFGLRRKLAIAHAIGKKLGERLEIAERVAKDSLVQLVEAQATNIALDQEFRRTHLRLAQTARVVIATDLIYVAGQPPKHALESAHRMVAAATVDGRFDEARAEVMMRTHNEEMNKRVAQNGADILQRVTNLLTTPCECANCTASRARDAAAKPLPS